jgi:hypothetical protein
VALPLVQALLDAVTPAGELIVETRRSGIHPAGAATGDTELYGHMSKERSRAAVDTKGPSARPVSCRLSPAPTPEVRDPPPFNGGNGRPRTTVQAPTRQVGSKTAPHVFGWRRGDQAREVLAPPLGRVVLARRPKPFVWIDDELVPEVIERLFAGPRGARFDDSREECLQIPGLAFSPMTIFGAFKPAFQVTQ